MHSRLVAHFLILVASLPFLFTGCSQTEVAPAVKRNSAKKMFSKQDIEARRQLDLKTTPSAGKSIPFVLDDHFALIAIDSYKLTSSKNASDECWDKLSQTIQMQTGWSLSLEKLEKIWVMIDRELSETFFATGSNPVVLVLELKSDISWAMLSDELNQARNSSLNSERQTGSKLIELKLGEVQEVGENIAILPFANRIAIIGAPMALDKFDNSGETNQNLIDRFYALRQGAITAVVDVEAIRPQLQPIFGMMKFGPFADYAKLPDVTQQVSVVLDLDNDTRFAEVELKMTDRDLIGKIASNVQSVIESGSQFAEEEEGGENLEESGGGFGFGGFNQGRQKMLQPSSPKSLTKLFEEIGQRQLLSVTEKADSVTMKLGRPNEFGNVLWNLIDDRFRQARLQMRVEQAEAIAAALKAYHEKFGHLPPAGQVLLKEADENTRAQFNWLTGILPELGHQAIYDKFDFSIEFNMDTNPDANESARNNYELLEWMPSQIGSMIGRNHGDAIGIGTTHFKVAGGTGLWGDGSIGPRLEDISDELESTALVFETALEEPWCAPNSGLWNVDEVDEQSVGWENNNGILFIDAEFRVRIVERQDALLIAIISPAGGEELNETNFIQTTETR